jgi:hypothetical protein
LLIVRRSPGCYEEPGLLVCSCLSRTRPTEYRKVGTYRTEGTDPFRQVKYPIPFLFLRLTSNRNKRSERQICYCRLWGKGALPTSFVQIKVCTIYCAETNLLYIADLIQHRRQNIKYGKKRCFFTVI